MAGPAVRRCLPSGGWSGNTPINVRVSDISVYVVVCLSSVRVK